jgi:molecular chaperone HtpG
MPLAAWPPKCKNVLAAAVEIRRRLQEDSMSDEIEILPVEIHLPGLLKLLGEHLYSDPRVAVREMVQNAHDTCIRRREEGTALAGVYQPRIDVRIDHVAGQLCIEDNGSGLTRDEIGTFLATIGRGYTGELRERLGAAGREEALDLIGLFGLSGPSGKFRQLLA